MITAEQIQQMLQASFPEALVKVAGEGNKFDLLIVDEQFETMRPVAKQQAVYAVLNEHIASGIIHAVNIQALTPAEHKSKSRFG